MIEDKNTQFKEVYFSSSRSEVASLVPLEAKTILDVGCGFGGLGKLLRKREIDGLFGIELNSSASIYLEKIYDQHWIGSVESINLPSNITRIDCIIFSDILEHLADPWRVLTRFASLLSDSGTIVASIPNVRNLGLLYRLVVKGEWTYSADGGLLDITHLRFFTRSEIEGLFKASGLEIVEWGYNYDRYSFIRRVLTFIPRILVPDLEVCQFLIRARKIM